MNTHFATYITTHSLVRGTRTHIYIRTYTSTIVWVWWRDHQIMLIALSARPTTTTARQQCFGCFCCCCSCFFYYCNSCIFLWLRLAFNTIHMHFMYEVTCTDTLTNKQMSNSCVVAWRVLLLPFRLTHFVGVRRGQQLMHARTLTHCQSHTDTHPHVLTKNCKTDCEKCRMRWVGTIGDAKSILDFVYSMFVCVCVCILCIPSTHEPHLPARPTIEV